MVGTQCVSMEKGKEKEKGKKVRDQIIMQTKHNHGNDPNIVKNANACLCYDIIVMCGA